MKYLQSQLRSLTDCHHMNLPWQGRCGNSCPGEHLGAIRTSSQDLQVGYRLLPSQALRLLWCGSPRFKRTTIVDDLPYFRALSSYFLPTNLGQKLQPSRCTRPAADPGSHAHGQTPRSHPQPLTSSCGACFLLLVPSAPLKQTDLDYKSATFYCEQQNPRAKPGQTLTGGEPVESTVSRKGWWEPCLNPQRHVLSLTAADLSLFATPRGELLTGRTAIH